MRNERVFNDKKRNRKSKSDVSLNQEKTEDDSEDGEGLIRSYLYLGAFASSFCGTIKKLKSYIFIKCLIYKISFHFHRTRRGS
jgi:hypothetical protein